jgi:hypothetical protein
MSADMPECRKMRASWGGSGTKDPVSSTLISFRQKMMFKSSSRYLGNFLREMSALIWRGGGSSPGAASSSPRQGWMAIGATPSPKCSGGMMQA